MPKRTDIKKVLIIGSGPIVIGQACELFSVEGHSPEPHDRQWLQLFLGRHDLWQNRDGTLRHADDRRVFLRPHFGKGGGKTAAPPLSLQ